MTSRKGWLNEWEEETEERRPAPPPPAPNLSLGAIVDARDAEEASRLGYKLEPSWQGTAERESGRPARFYRVIEAPGAAFYVAGTTTNPAETARLRYRTVAPAECAHGDAPAASPAVCPACGLVLS